MTFLLLLACVVVGATGGYVLATRGSQPTDLSKLPDPPGFYDATSLAVGSDSACAIVAGGRVECWGADSGGLLGTGGSSAAGCDGGCTSAAQAVASVTGAVSVAVGDEFACVLCAPVGSTAGARTITDSSASTSCAGPRPVLAAAAQSRVATSHCLFQVCETSSASQPARLMPAR